MRTFLLALSWFYGFTVWGQGIALNTSGANADPSAMLDISAQQKGLLIPRLNTVERNGIMQPARALLIFNTTTARFEVNTGTPLQPVWESIVTLEALNTQNLSWNIGGNNLPSTIGVLGTTNAKSIGFITGNILRLYVDSTTGRVGINTQIPQSGLHVATTDAVILPSGTTAQRPVVPVPGMIRFNTESGKLEGYTTDGWKSLQ